MALRGQMESKEGSGSLSDAKNQQSIGIRGSGYAGASLWWRKTGAPQ